jgi:transposase
VISGILHILKTGGRWRDVPPEYGPAKTTSNRYTRWARRGVWQRIFAKVAAAGPIPEELALNSSNVKAHRSASGEKGGAHASGWRLARRPNNENPLSGR